MRNFFVAIAACLLLTCAALAEKAGTSNPSGADSERPIQDNSLLIEEAYNQEYGVVQHINTFSRVWNSNDWTYTFTQEWPWNPHPKSQLSYTVSAMSVPSYDRGAGFGDVMLNYRYQLVGNGDSKVAFSPRFSVLLPTGNWRLGRGVGATGTQLNLPVSWSMSRRFVTHWNAGATFIPRAHSDTGEKAFSHGFNLGQSTVLLAAPRLNILVETAYTAGEAAVAKGKTEWARSLYVNPAVRWSHNFKNGLQIVPGVGFPIGVGRSSGKSGIFLYVSFEHPFAKPR